MMPTTILSLAPAASARPNPRATPVDAATFRNPRRWIDSTIGSSPKKLGRQEFLHPLSELLILHLPQSGDLRFVEHGGLHQSGLDRVEQGGDPVVTPQQRVEGEFSVRRRKVVQFFQ